MYGDNGQWGDTSRPVARQSAINKSSAVCKRGFLVRRLMGNLLLAEPWERLEA